MNIKQFRGLVCFGCLAPSLAWAQPVITNQPVDQFGGDSFATQFSVGVSGTPPIAYQWLFDGTAIAGATTHFLQLPALDPTNSGDYSVIVSNASGSVTSRVAVLKVFLAAPHDFSGIQADPGGSVSLFFTGETTASFARYYDMYPLETSSNLVDWAPLATLQRTNATMDVLSFLDTNAPEFSRRFFRTPANQLATPDPQPTGPYPVGTFSMLLTDPSRRNAAGNGNYEFMVTFWYPAVAQAGVLPANYVESQLALAAGGDYNMSPYGEDFGSEVEAFFSHSISNAPVAANPAAFPVVLYDPGSGGHRRENTDKTEELASWGYVVVGLDTSDTFLSVFPDGTVVAGAADYSTVADLDLGIEGRLLDLQSVMDELAGLNAGDPRLGGRLDLEKIGVFGWVLGGATAAQLCLRDPRCKAGASLDGNYFETNLLTQPLSVPWLFFRADDGPDPVPGFTLPDGRPDDRLQVYNQQVTNAYWVRVVSTIHGNFSDPGLIYALGGTPMSGQFLPPARVSQIVRAYLLSFFNKFLQGEDDHLLDGPSPAYPEVGQFLSKPGSSVVPEYPSAPLVQGGDGNFYGTTEFGGMSGDGTVFRLTSGGALTTLVSFNGTNGSHPVAALAQGGDGNFYGTTEYGGTNGNNGTVFQMTAAGVLTTLASFNGANGSRPLAGLVQDSNANFYGTTFQGGANNLGTVFSMTPAGVLTTLVAFTGANGGLPRAPLMQATNGNFYGTTSRNYGSVFKITPAGVLKTLGTLNASYGSSTGGIVQGNAGHFYGTTYNFGYGFGTVFKLTSTGAIETLLSFNSANGGYPSAGLVQGGDGNFYGTTDGGGAGGGGTVFKLTPAGALTTLVAFNGANGRNPQSPLVVGKDGNFYGTTAYRGAGFFGTVYQMTPAGTLTTLAAFGGQTNSP